MTLSVGLQDGAAAKGEASIAQALPLPDSDTEDEPAVSSEDNDPAPAGSEDPFLSGQMSGDFGPPGSTAAASASTKPAPGGILMMQIYRSPGSGCRSL